MLITLTTDGWCVLPVTGKTVSFPSGHRRSTNLNLLSPTQTHNKGRGMPHAACIDVLFVLFSGPAVEPENATQRLWMVCLLPVLLLFLVSQALSKKPNSNSVPPPQ
jgi:hypothetical protein